MSHIQSRAHSNLTILLGEKLLLHVFSYLDYQQLFQARMVCTRWRRICERPEVYAYSKLTMQEFISNSKLLPMHILLSFVESLSLSGDEVDAIKVCCREIANVDSAPVTPTISHTNANTNHTDTPPRTPSSERSPNHSYVTVCIRITMFTCYYSTTLTVPKSGPLRMSKGMHC